MIRISFRLGIIFAGHAGPGLDDWTGGKVVQRHLAVILILIVLIAELFHKINRTNRIIESLLDSIRFGRLQQENQWSG